MERQCDCTNIQREGGHPGLWELQRLQHDISYHEDSGKNNRQKTEVEYKHRRRAEQFDFMPSRGTNDAIIYLQRGR